MKVSFWLAILKGHFSPLKKISKFIPDNPLAKLTSEKSKEEVLILLHKILKSYFLKNGFWQKKLYYIKCP